MKTVIDYFYFGAILFYLFLRLQLNCLCVLNSIKPNLLFQ